LKAYYKDQEFIRIGYYVQNLLPDGVDSTTNHETLDLRSIERQIVIDDYTVHPSQINWN